MYGIRELVTLGTTKPTNKPTTKHPTPTNALLGILRNVVSKSKVNPVPSRLCHTIYYYDNKKYLCLGEIKLPQFPEKQNLSS